MDTFPIDEAALVAFFIESTTWGIQLVTFILCVWTLVQTNRVSKPRPINPLLLYATALIVIGTPDVSFSLYHVLRAFVYYKGQGGADLVFKELSDYVTVLRSVWNFLAVLVADSALIHRCWIIYSRRWKYVIPSMFVWLGGFACACAEIYYSSTSKKPTGLVGSGKADFFVGAFFVCTGILNIFVTGLILYRIHVVHHASTRCFSLNPGSTILVGRIQWSQLSRILVESALVYTLSGIIALIVTLAGSNAIYPVSDFIVQLSGIQFDLIVIRVGRGIAVEHIEAETSKLETQIQLGPLGRSVPEGHPGVVQISVTTDTDILTDRTYPRSGSGMKGVTPNLIESSKPAGMVDHYA